LSTKKLELVGSQDELTKSRYFESISENDFNSVMDKQLLQIKSLTLQKLKDYPCLSGVEVQAKNGMISKNLGQNLDS